MRELTELSDADLEAALKEVDKQLGYREQYGIKAPGLEERMGALDAEANRRCWYDGERPKGEGAGRALLAEARDE